MVGQNEDLLAFGHLLLQEIELNGPATTVIKRAV